MKELLVDICGFEGLYQISNQGRVFSVKKKIFIKLDENNQQGYQVVKLCKNGKRYKFRVHRLVAEAFIPNPENKPCVDHINTIRNDNRVENLRWVTYKENLDNPLTREKIVTNIPRGENHPMYGRTGEATNMYGRTGEFHPRSKSIICITTNKRFGSITEGANYYNIDSLSLSKHLLGKGKSCGKSKDNIRLKWKYEEVS